MTKLGLAHTDERGARPWLRLALLTVVAALPVTACSLDVTDPDIITPDNLQGASTLPTIRAAAIGDFALSYGGSGADGSSGTEGIIMMSGLLADEWINSETFPTRIEIDRRAILLTNGTLAGWFRTLSRTRRSTEFAASRYRALSDTTANTGLSEMLSLSGYTYLWFAENWCSGVPFSTANPDGSLVFGSPLTTREMLDTAVSRFTQALKAANAAVNGVSSGSRRIVQNLARIGLARALLDRDSTGDVVAARDTVDSVLTSFAYQLGYSETTTRENNGVFVADNISKRYSVAEGEGGHGLRYRTANDPRIPSVQLQVGTPPAGNLGFDGTTAQFDQLRFPDRKTSIPLATGAEARLIQAEAALRTPGDTSNNGGVFYTKLNGLRSAPPGYFWQNPSIPAPTSMPTLTTDSATVYGGALKLLFRERALWMWLSAHRLSDLRRLSRQYGMVADSVFPFGSYFKQGAGPYGTDVNFPVPFEETNNPNFKQCLDRAP